MKFLLDANLSPLIATRLDEAGHDARHVRDVDLRHAGDEQIMDFAAEHGFDQFEDALVKGAVVSIVDDRIRVRRLPFQ